MEEKVVEPGIQKIATDFGYEPGDTFKIRGAKSLDFQGIVDAILNVVGEVPGFPKEKLSTLKRVRYANGIEVSVPEALFGESGKDVTLKWFREAFPVGAAKINQTIAMRYIEKTDLIWTELVALFESIGTTE